MDASSQSSTSTQAVESPRRKRSVEERVRIVTASLKKGTTVDAVAKVYGVHASQLYEWRKQHRQGLLRDKVAALLPVQVAEADPPAVPESQPPQDGRLVIEARGVRVTISGGLDATIIRTVLGCLAQ
jgi:transposase